MNRTIIVSGASSGIGFAIASTLHKKGYDVIGVSRTYPKQSYEFKYHLADITQETDIDNLVSKITEEYSHVYALINCAGMGISGAVEYTKIEDIKKMYNVNVFGTFLMTKAFIPLLRGVKQAKIINISSVAGDLSIPFQTFYSMTKASINAFSSALALELKPFDISVCSILPGDTQTSFTQNREKSEVITDEFYLDRIKHSIERMEKDEQNGKDPLSVAQMVLKLLKRKRMPSKVTVGFQYKLFVLLNRLLPTRLVQWILYQMYAKK